MSDHPCSAFCPFAADKCGAACRWQGSDLEQLPLEEP